MIRLIRFLITGDWHLCKWEVFGEMKRFFHTDELKRPYKATQAMKCKHCGKIKVFDT